MADELSTGSRITRSWALINELLMFRAAHPDAQLARVWRHVHRDQLGAARKVFEQIKREANG